MVAVIIPINSAAIDVSEWGKSGFANSNSGLYPDQLNPVSEN